MATRTGHAFRQPEEVDELPSTQTPNEEGPVFTLFPKLPIEIRCIIISEAAQHPRVVEIGSYDTKRQGRFEVRFTSRTIVPSILHTFSESRAVGTKFYDRLIFGGRFTGTYVNWNADVITFNQSCSLYTAMQYLDLDCNQSDLTEKCSSLAVRDVYSVRDLIKKGNHFRNLQRVISVQETPSCPGLQSRGDGNLKLVPISQEEIATFKHWRLRNHEASLQRLEDLKKKEPRIKHLALMTATRGPQRRYSPAEKTARWRQARVIETPKPQKISFKSYRLVELQRSASERGLKTDGSKKDLIGRLEVHEEARFAQAMGENEQ